MFFAVEDRVFLPTVAGGSPRPANVYADMSFITVYSYPGVCAQLKTA